MIHNKLLTLVTLFITLFKVQVGIAQSTSYILLDDPSGMGPSASELAELERAADSLVAAFPTEFQSQFKVIEGAIYPILGYTTGGIEEAWLKLKTMAGLESDYYLLLVMEYGSSSKNKWRVDLKLPVTGDLFGCLDEMGSNYFNSLTSKIQSSLNGQTVEDLPTRGIEEFRKIIRQIAECCQEGFRDIYCSNCLYNPTEFLKYLTDNDYIKIPINIDPANRIAEYNCVINSLKENELSYRSGSIINYVEYNIDLNENFFSLATMLNSNVGSNINGSFNIYILDFNNVMDNSFFSIAKEIKNQKGGMIYFIDNYSTNPFLYISPTSVDVNLHQDFSYLLDIQNEEDVDDCPDCPDWMKEIWNDNYNPNEDSYLSYVVPAIPLAAVDGPLPVADVVIAAAAAAVVTYDLTQRVYITYVAYNPHSNEYYCGRTSGFKVPGEILDDRLKTHHAVPRGYIVNVDKSIQGYPVGYWAIRGREQQLIDYYGGAMLDSERRPNSKCVNKIRGVAKSNPMGYLYHWLSSLAWGEKYPYTGYGTTDIEKLWNKLSSIERMKKWFGY